MVGHDFRVPTWDIAKRTSLADSPELIERFRDLQQANRHALRTHTPLERNSFIRAQTEMWIIAQRLTVYQDRDLQWNIDMLRAKIVSQLKAHLGTGAFSMQPSRRTRPLLWQDIDITPEITCDPTLTGTTALSRDVRSLRRLLREQRVIISALVR